MPDEAPLPNVFFTIAINGKEIGKLEFKLFDDVTPKTAANFRSLSTGKKPDGTALPLGFGYRGTKFHRVIPGFMVQGGDFERHDGTGGQSIYGDKFPDENFDKRHDRPFLLSSANAGPNTNGSQFFITTAERCDWLDGKHTVFGELVSGKEVVKEIESKGNKEGKPPKEKIVITECGAV
ncbi:hypothetical protein CI109_104516 [Kwoniella shandongensis]|uniref:Peptidyl-prolyl cis-trans isomerase n=1 Tax=Kwoniella shandongensis TaxID=1734106 RepID=A0A5M6BN12_9TREE|nr:uncharacterized protein CI109_007408 [Kwoniella shandongensis]KAA5524256.1 hypothetical protein CI109_007408 [Kwoniella shandongensis]